MNDQNPTTVTRELTPLILFDGLNVEEIRAINGLTTTVTFEAGETIFTQSAPDDSLYVLVSGQVRVDIEEGGSTRQVAVLDPGAVLGEVGLLIKEARSATATAQTGAKLLKLPRDTFRAELDNGNLAAYKVIFNIARDMARKLRHMNHQLEEMTAGQGAGELRKLDDLLKDWI